MSLSDFGYRPSYTRTRLRELAGVDIDTTTLTGGEGIEWDATDGEWVESTLNVVSAEYLSACQASNQTTDIGDGDHLKFAVIDASKGSSISLDTAAYPALGRITLAPLLTYKMFSDAAYIDGVGNNAYARYQWYDVTAGAFIGPRGSIEASTETDTDGLNATVVMFFTPLVETVVEVRITSVGGDTDQIGSATWGLSRAIIEVVADSTKLADVGGATSSTAGVAGLVPAPAAGQEGAALLGSGAFAAAGALQATWTGADYAFPAAGSPIQLDTTLFDSATGQIARAGNAVTLQPGPTYELSGALRVVAADATTDKVVQWRNTTAGAYIGTTFSSNPGVVTSGKGTSGPAVAILVLAVATTVELWSQTTTGAGNVDGNSSTCVSVKVIR